jgi:mannose-6-phosphate isomerase-like protein (cupin superfamily)
MTIIVPGQRTTLSRHRRDLEVILASAPAGAAVVVACTVPAATSGPPLHVHAASDETFFIVSGALLVHADGHVATIREGGLVHINWAYHTRSRRHPTLRRTSCCCPPHTT